MSLERGTMGRLSVQRLSKRFTRNKEYDRVDDTSDTRVPLYNEEAFQHGLKFKAKYIGSAEISKPSSKLDIITAMRRIRYDYKVKGVKKQRCLIDVSTDGVKVTKRKRRRRKQYTEQQLFMMQHAIYRIFYVSHDSQDLKIFSYITREVPSNIFKCNVFKAYKKRMALHVVRSLGQAFDVCHKINPRSKKKKAVASSAEETPSKTTTEEKNEKENGEETKLDEIKEPAPNNDNNNKEEGQSFNTALDSINGDPFSPGGGDTAATTTTTTTSGNDSLPPLIDLDPLVSFNIPTLPPIPGSAVHPPVPLSAYVGRPRPRPGQTVIQENPMMAGSTDSVKGNLSPSISLGEPLNETDSSPLEQERQQMKAQMTLLTEKLHSETNARIESQARVEHLLLQNKELLSHLQKLMVQLQQLQSLQMSQITNPQPPPQPAPVAKTPPKSHPPATTTTPLDMTPPTTDQSEPSNSETQLHSVFNSSNEEESPTKSNDPPTQQPNSNIISDELPLLVDIITPIEEPPVDIDAAFMPQVVESNNNNDIDQATLDAAFTPNSVSVAS